MQKKMPPHNSECIAKRMVTRTGFEPVSACVKGM